MAIDINEVKKVEHAEKAGALKKCLTKLEDLKRALESPWILNHIKHNVELDCNRIGNVLMRELNDHD